MLTDWMTPEPITVDVDTPLERCRALLSEGRIRHLPVLEGGWLIGVLDGVSIEGATEETRTAGDLTVRRAPSMALGAEPKEVLAALQDTDNDVVILTDEGRPAGLFSEHDAVRLGAEHLQTELTLERYATRSLATIDANATAEEARQRFAAEVQRHLIVLHDGRLYAILSWRDVENTAEGMLVSECVRPVQWRIGWSSSLKDAASTMASNHIGALPIVDPAGNVEGILTRTDVMTALLETL